MCCVGQSQHAVWDMEPPTCCVGGHGTPNMLGGWGKIRGIDPDIEVPLFKPSNRV